MEAIVNALVLFGVSLLLALAPAAALWRLPQRPKPIRFALLLCYHALFCLLGVLLLNGLPGYFVENTEVYAKLELLQDRDERPERPFILIDNSGNKQLVPDPEGNLEDSTVVVVTDRTKLARLLQRLAAKQELIAQVVVDIRFVEPSAADSSLREAVLDLAAHGKILLARAHEGNTDRLDFGADVMADVTAYEQEDLLVWYRSAREEGHALPYALYLRLHRRTAEPFALGLWKESGEGGPTRLVYPGFMPTWSHLPKVNDEAMGPDRLPMPIGHALDAGWSRLLRRLDTAGEGMEPVVFIGEFPLRANEASVDLHRSYAGTSTGSAMLVDLYHEMERGAHVVKGRSLMGLFIALLLCSWFVFTRAWPRTSEPPPVTFSAIVRKHVEDALKGAGPLLVLIAVAWWMRAAADQQMNLAPALIYFVVLMGLVGAVRRVRQRKLDADRTGRKAAQ